MTIRLCLALTALFFSQGALANPPANWEFKEWNEAVVQANAEKRPILVMFGYEDCRWCEYLYRRGMNDADLRAKYKQSVVLAYVDTKSHKPDEEFAMPGGAKTTHAELIRRFQAYPTPSWVFLSPSGEVLHTGRNGKSTSRDMLRDLETALSKL
ncbi:MAG: thioredoxin fold domain-containing protein [Rudaea sp.]